MTESRHPFRSLLFIALLAGLSACAPAIREAPPPAPEPARLSLQAASFDTLPGWRQDRQDLAFAAFLRSCARIAGRPPYEPFGPSPHFGRVGDWQSVCAAAQNRQGDSPDRAREFFEAEFVLFAVRMGDAEDGLITGYYEPELHGAWRRGGKFRHPLYRPPRDLISVNLGDFDSDWKGRQIAGRVVNKRLVPHAERAAIEAGELAGRGLELMWLDDPVDAFFLHVQGSGRVRMTDGSTVRVGFAGRNGHAYTAIGRHLVESGDIPADQVSMQSIRAWLESHPGKAQSVMNLNRSYIFFRQVADGNEADGPVGAQGAPLTAGRSLAVDRAHWPLGMPVWLDTGDPRQPGRPLRALVVAQDTGSAITGPIRGDFFWGSGPEAEAAAGRMRERGSFHVLLPRRARPPS